MRFKIEYIYYIFAILLIPAIGFSQNYQEEIGFTFVKARYLLDTERYDDAVREFNRVINENPSHEDVLALRAMAKYRLNAFVGTKKDILKFIELKGITPEAVSLLAKAEYQLGELDAALNSLTTAIQLIKIDVDLYEFRASIYMDRDMTLQACADWNSAALLGSVRAELAARQNCRGLASNMNAEGRIPPTQIMTDQTKDHSNPKVDPTSSDPIGKEIENTLQDSAKNITIPSETGTERMDSGASVGYEANGKLHSDSSYEDGFYFEDEIYPIDPRLLDESTLEIVVDEDLTLFIKGQGLGSRPILRQPNILMLSDSDGEVVIDICVSRGGRVISHSFNQEASTFHRKSIVSLAMRHAPAFWFEKSDLMEQCGQIIFKIKGS